jgi:hypothetical protein
MAGIYQGTGAFIRREMDSLTGAYSVNTWPTETITSTDPKDYVLTLGNAKEMLPVNTDVHDSLITMLIEATTEQVERYIARDTYKRQRTSYYERPANQIWLPYGVHGNVISVTAIDEDNNETVLTSGADYTVFGLEFKAIRLSTGAPYLRVVYESGYDFGACPAAIKAAIMQELSLQYKNRQDPNAPGRTVVNNLSVEARNLLTSYIRHVV